MLHAKRFSLLFISFFFIVNCRSSLPASQGSVLILALSGLSADEFGDGSSTENITPHLEKLVKESVRFTHAYTTSPLENAGLGSIFTGVYPFENGVTTNGANTYAENIKSIPELAAAKGFYNFFLSGGPPLLRKTGVSRGFNDFDDSFRASEGYYLPARSLSEKFLNFYENKMESEKFFGVIYFTDLLFSGGPTKEKTLQEIDESIGRIRNKLMEHKTWDELTVVFTSLRGQGRFEGLYDDMVRIPLVIKPSRKHRDLSPSWKIDWGVNFADLGKTLHSILDLKLANKSKFEIKDFSKAMSSTDFAKDIPDSNRILFLESDLLHWRGWGESLYAIRQGEWVFFPRLKKLFNTYIDRGQINNMYGKDTDVTQRLEKTWQLLDIRSENKVKRNVQEAFYKINLAKTFFSNTSPLAEIQNAFQDFALTRSDWQVTQWYLSTLDQREEAGSLKKLLKKLKAKSKAEKQEILLWKKHIGISDNKESVDCEGALILIKSQNVEKRQRDVLRECRDKETQLWVQAYLSYKSKKHKDAFILYEIAKGMTDKRIKQDELAKYFWLNNTSWDLFTELPGELATFDFVLGQLPDTDFENFVKKKPNL